VHVESGAKLPVFSSGGFTLIQFTDTSTGVSRNEQLKASFSVSVTTTGSAPDYRVRIANLPEGYVLKSMKYGPTDITSAPLKIPPALLPRPTVTTVNGVTQAVITAATPAGVTAPSVIITLDKLPVAAAPGTRVTGSLKEPVADRYRCLGSASSILYSDGTFEFKGVVPDVTTSWQSGRQVHLHLELLSL
jgi:hypothetical protein